MRLQLSLEFLIYLAICGMAMLASVAVLTGYLGSLSGMGESRNYSDFLWLLSAAEYSGLGNFSAYVPSGLCSATAPGELTPQSTGYYLPEAIQLSKGSICPSGRVEQLSLDSGNGSIVMR